MSHPPKELVERVAAKEAMDHAKAEYDAAKTAYEKALRAYEDTKSKD